MTRVTPREEPGAGKLHARICEGESRMAELLDRDLPWFRCGYRTLDGENAAVEVCDDQLKRLGVGLSHGIFYRE